jgi:regulator of sigma E protease
MIRIVKRDRSASATIPTRLGGEPDGLKSIFKDDEERTRLFSSGFLNGLYIIPVLAILILIHELGHFFAARRCGVKVEEFGIGIPPRIKGWTRDGVIWSINAIPFGGFVRVKGEDGANTDSDSMNSKSPAQRAFFLVAGVVMNLLLAVVLMIVVVGIKGITHENIYVGGTSAGSPAAKAGWLAGDRIVAINGHTVKNSDDVSTATKDHAGDSMTVTIERRGQDIDTTVSPREHPPKNEGRVGITLVTRYTGAVTLDNVVAGSPAAAAGLQNGDQLISINNRPVADSFVVETELTRFEGFSVPVTYERAGQTLTGSIAVPVVGISDDLFQEVGFHKVVAKPIFEKVPLIDVVPRGFKEAYSATMQMVHGIEQLFSSRDNLSQVAGPIGMGQLTSELIEQSPFPVWYSIANLSIILSLNLALLNLLPLPALDGGRLFFVLIEVLRGGRKIAPEKEGLVHLAGLVLLLGLMFVIGFSDITRLVNGKSFLP